MKFACMSCAAKYSVPDGRLAAAGSGGLRVRCTRCRAIMVVAADAFRMEGPSPEPRRIGEDDDTRKELRFRGRARPAAQLPRGGASMGIMAASDSMSDEGPIAETMGGVMAVPAALSASGVFRAMPGVNRQVTGLFFPELDRLTLEGKQTTSRVWYAAVDGRPRGPFSASEMMGLAERGKIRDATLVWRPGYPSWKKIRHGDAPGSEDLSWLRKVVLARKLREMDAQERAQDRLGIAPVQLTRTSAGRNRPSLAPTWQGGAAGMPPALPDDADEVPALSLNPRTLLEPSAWRAEELPSVPRRLNARGTRRASRAFRVVMAALLMALASVALAAGDSETLERFASFVPFVPTLSP